MDPKLWFFYYFCFKLVYCFYCFYIVGFISWLPSTISPESSQSFIPCGRIIPLSLKWNSLCISLSLLNGPRRRGIGPTALDFRQDCWCQNGGHCETLEERTRSTRWLKYDVGDSGKVTKLRCTLCATYQMKLKFRRNFNSTFIHGITGAKLIKLPPSSPTALPG